MALTSQQDFIQSKDGKLYPIECNPRVHTAICLLATNERFAQAYLSSQQHEVIKPLPRTKARTWLGHDLPVLFLPSLIPQLRRLHPLVPVNPQLQVDVVDPMFEWQDPWPFFALYHIQWPFLLLRQLLIRRKKWQRINASTARIFECP
jgi:hypothetical protein